MPKKTRYYYLDILKFIAIFLVCSYHFTWAGDLSYAENMPALTVFKRGVFGIGSMCIPLFFMVNGSLLLNREMDLHKHIKNSIVLLLQYFFWRFITIVILAGYNGLTLPQVGKMNLLKAVFCYGNIEGIRYNHLWFIPTLLCIYWIVPFLKKDFDQFSFRKNKSFTFFFMIFLLIVCFVKSFGIFNPFRDMVGTMLFYFLLGGVLHKYLDRIQKIPCYAPLLLFFFGAAWLTGKWIVESKAIQSTWDNVFSGYGTLPTLMMAVSIFALVAKIPNGKIENSAVISKIVKILGDNTISVYYFHWIFGYTALAYIQEHFIPYTGILINSLKALVIVVLFSLLGYWMKKVPIVNRLLH